MAKKRERSKIDPNAWMNTYSDMVTLLMCFFVLLYAASTPDETKFQYIFQNFTSSGKYINPFVMDEDPNRTQLDSESEGNALEPPGDPTESNDYEISNTDLPTNFNNLASWFSGVAAASEFSEDISVSVNSSGSITIRFNDSVLFGPDSAELLPRGREAIALFLPGIKGVSEYIGKIEVAGHTAVGLSPINDWDLSSARACSVVKFMDWRRVVDSEVYLPEGYAQYTPIAPNDTEEGKAKNRRVEITIIRNDNNTISNDVVEDILAYDYGIVHGYGSGSNPSSSDAVQQIINKLEEKYETIIDDEGNVLGSESGPNIPNAVDGIPSDIIHDVDEEGHIITDASEAPPQNEGE